MSVRSHYQYPEDKQALLNKAKRLEWITIGFHISIVTVMYLALGSSQAMKTAWIGDILTMVPPIVFLISLRIRQRPPDPSYPYGYRRITLLAYLMAAAAVLVVGVYLIFDSGLSLINQEHPTLGHFNLFGHYVWIGWVMLAALSYAMLPPLILGHLKIKIAKELHEKTLYADSTMNKSDWMTSAAAIVGIIGIGFGFWWLDAVAAIFIAFDILWDGYKGINSAMTDLMDGRPRSVEAGKPLGMEERLTKEVLRSPLIEDASVRLREEGITICGEVFVQLKGQAELGRQLLELTEELTESDWRYHNLVIIPVDKIEKSLTQSSVSVVQETTEEAEQRAGQKDD